MANGITNIGGGKAPIGTAQPSDVRLGMTYADGKELREGTLDLRNLKAENVKKNVNIAGVVGAYEMLKSVRKETISIAPKSGDLSPGQTVHLFTLPAGTIFVEALYGQAIISSGYYEVFHTYTWSPDVTALQIYNDLELKFVNNQKLATLSLSHGMSRYRSSRNSPTKGYCTIHSMSFVNSKLRIGQLEQYPDSREIKEESFSPNTLGTPYDLQVYLRGYRYINSSAGVNPNQYEKTVFYRTEQTSLIIYRI